MSAQKLARSHPRSRTRPAARWQARRWQSPRGRARCLARCKALHDRGVLRAWPLPGPWACHTGQLSTCAARDASALVHGHENHCCKAARSMLGVLHYRMPDALRAVSFVLVHRHLSLPYTSRLASTRKNLEVSAQAGACRQHDAQQCVQQHKTPTANSAIAAAPTPRKASSARNAHAGACASAARGSALRRPGASFALPGGSDDCQPCGLAASGATPNSRFAAGPGPGASVLLTQRAAASSAGAGAGSNAGASTTAGAASGLKSCTQLGCKPGPGPKAPQEAQSDMKLLAGCCCSTDQHTKWRAESRRRDKGLN